MPDVGDMVTARIVAELSGQPIINNLSFTLIAPFATWREAANQLHIELNSALNIDAGGGVWTQDRGTLYQTNALQVIDVFPAVSPLIQYALNAPGNLDDPTMPPNDCLAVTLRSDFKGPSGRGRIYLAGYTESAATNGFWEAGAQDAATAIMNNLDLNFGEFAGGASFRWVILHKVAGGAPVVPPEVKPVMSWTIHNEIRSLSRRAMGRRIRRRPAA